MTQIWRLLGIQPTKDIAEIKQAYANQAKQTHPEEHPEAFRALHDAYRAALRYAKSENRQPPVQAAALHTDTPRTPTAEKRLAEPVSPESVRPDAEMQPHSENLFDGFRKPKPQNPQPTPQPSENELTNADFSRILSEERFRHIENNLHEQEEMRDAALQAARDLYANRSAAYSKRAWRRYYASPAVQPLLQDAAFIQRFSLFFADCDLNRAMATCAKEAFGLSRFTPDANKGVYDLLYTTVQRYFRTAKPYLEIWEPMVFFFLRILNFCRQDTPRKVLTVLGIVLLVLACALPGVRYAAIGLLATKLYLRAARKKGKKPKS